MGTILRFLAVQAFVLWQGGFLFYAGFVVPAGTRVLGSAEGQGRITARVTDSLNVCGAIALALMFTDMLRGRSRMRFVLWFAMVVLQIGLFHLHLELDARMDADRTFVVNRDEFYGWHRLYLIASTVQWVAGLGWLWFTLRSSTPGRTPKP